MDSIRQDLRYAWRSLLRQPSFTLLAVATLALGIGATSAIFSVVYGVLLPPLPYPDADRLVAISEVNRRGTFSRLADPNFDDFRDPSHTLAAVRKTRPASASATGTCAPT